MGSLDAKQSIISALYHMTNQPYVQWIGIGAASSLERICNAWRENSLDYHTKEGSYSWFETLFSIKHFLFTPVICPITPMGCELMCTVMSTLGANKQSQNDFMWLPVVNTLL